MYCFQLRRYPFSFLCLKVDFFSHSFDLAMTKFSVIKDITNISVKFWVYNLFVSDHIHLHGREDLLTHCFSSVGYWFR